MAAQYGVEPHLLVSRLFLFPESEPELGGGVYSAAAWLPTLGPGGLVGGLSICERATKVTSEKQEQNACVSDTEYGGPGHMG